jgi:hypothetical protein
MKRLVLMAAAGLLATGAEASQELASQRFREAREFQRSGQYFRAARYAFNAGEEDPDRKSEAHAWVAQALVQAGLEQSASYFYLQVVRSANSDALRKVLPLTSKIAASVGLEFLRPFLARHTRLADYPASERGYYLYSAARTAGLKGDYAGALAVLDSIPGSGPMRAELLQLRAAFRLMTGADRAAAGDFAACSRAAKGGSDLENRCVAGEARALYELREFDRAERVYERVDRQSIVWTDILFEQGWNAYRRGEFNRTLGRLVSYKSPALSFVYNPEIDTLRAQAYLALCLYEDANEGVNEFNSRYAAINDEVRALLTEKGMSLGEFYDEGKEAALAPLGSKRPLHRLMNRFVRSAAFQDWVRSERELGVELGNIRQFSAGIANLDPNSESFGAFLKKVLDFRLRAIREMGGAFVRNSLLDYHEQLIAQFEKVAFIKLEMLGRFKEKLLSRKSSDGRERERGNVTPERRDDQFFWSFNGEFWNDELGDYVFGLESECDGKS